MESHIRVHAIPSKPVLIYDGECQFCRFWMRRWHAATGDKVEYVPSQDPTVPRNYPEIPRENYGQSIQYIETTGIVYHGAEAACRSLSINPRLRWTSWLYYRFPGGKFLGELVYRLVSAHRPAFAAVNRLIFGRKAERA